MTTLAAIPATSKIATTKDRKGKKKRIKMVSHTHQLWTRKCSNGRLKNNNDNRIYLYAYRYIRYTEKMLLNHRNKPSLSMITLNVNRLPN